MNVSFHTPWRRVDREGTCPACRAESSHVFVVQTGNEIIWVNCRECGWESHHYRHTGHEPTPVSVLVHANEIALTQQGRVLVHEQELDHHESYDPVQPVDDGNPVSTDWDDTAEPETSPSDGGSWVGSLRSKLFGPFTR